MTEVESQMFGYIHVCDQHADPIKVEDLDVHKDRVVGEWCVVLRGVVRSGSGSWELGLGDVRGLRNRVCRVLQYATGICLVKSEETVCLATF
jgi:hypothetical protein